MAGELTGPPETCWGVCSVSREQDALCDSCAEDGTFRQYVHEASSPRVCDSSGYWTPEEAEGKRLLSSPVSESPDRIFLVQEKEFVFSFRKSVVFARVL